MSINRRWAAIAAMAGLGLAAAGVAWAQLPSTAEVSYETRPPDPKDPKAKGEAPQLEARIIGAPSLPIDKLVLVDRSAKPPVRIKASAKRSYAEGTEPLALAIVMLGWEQWIGNDTFRPKDDPTREKGVLNSLRAGLDKTDFKALAPPGSLAMIVTYADKAQIRVPWEPLDKLRGATLGTQRDYRNTVGTELVKGIELALAELVKVKATVKAMIILTDGNDTNPDAAKAQLHVLKKRAAVDRVQTFAIIYKAADSVPLDVVGPVFTKTTTTATKADDVMPAILKSLQAVGNRQYVTFPGYDKDSKTGFRWDGEVHELMLEIDGQPDDPQQVRLIPKWAPAASAGTAPPAKRPAG